jgi:hypothetical protein
LGARLGEQGDLMKRKVLITLASTAIGSLVFGMSERPASARTVHAIAGTSIVGAERANFQATHLGVRRTIAANSNWIVPLVFDSPGPKTITVRGKVSTGGNMNCQVAALDTTANTASSTPLTTFPVTGTYTQIVLTLPTVPAGAMGFLLCQIAGAGTALLFGADYNP